MRLKNTTVPIAFIAGSKPVTNDVHIFIGSVMEKFVKKYAIINSSKAKVKVNIKVAIKENLHEGKIISNILPDSR